MLYIFNEYCSVVIATAPIKPLINIDSHIDANAKQWILYSEKSSD